MLMMLLSSWCLVGWLFDVVVVGCSLLENVVVVVVVVVDDVELI